MGASKACGKDSALYWQACVVVSGILVLIAGLVAMGTFGGDIKDNLQCFIDQFNALKGTVEDNPRMTAGVEAISEVDQSTIDTMQQVLDNLALIGLVPGLITSVFMFTVAATGALAAKGSSCCSCFSKLITTFAILFALFMLSFSAGLYYVGNAVSQDEYKNEWASTTSVCDTNTDDLEQQLYEAEDTLKTLEDLRGSTQQEITNAREDITSAQNQCAFPSEPPC
jgi:hypothetical protein